MGVRQFNLSANIESGVSGNEEYIVTPNVQRAVCEIVNGYHAGVHSFTIIGTYGTGKSCFLVNLEKDLQEKSEHNKLINASSLSERGSFEILNIVGEFCSLEETLSHIFSCEKDVIGHLRDNSAKLKRQNKILLIVIDEFGKVLEYAAKNNPEKELYFLQKLAECANNPNSSILLLTTLHQNFCAYATSLTSAQKNEWNKVKGRFQEIVFAEPVEQLLYLAAESMGDNSINDTTSAIAIYDLACRCKFFSASFAEDTAVRLFPLDAFSAIAVTKAIQRYGQNERSLFSFLSSKGKYSLTSFKQGRGQTYSLCEVYEYIVNCFYSYLSDANEDSMGWSAIKIAIERIETADWDSENLLFSAIKTAKVIGLLNLFGNAGFMMSKNNLAEYLRLALRISDAEAIIKGLEQKKIIRYAEYKGRYTLFEGTDVNIEEEVAKATAILPISINPAEELGKRFSGRIAPVKASYYRNGTPRYFEYTICDYPQAGVPKGDIDGYVEFVFSEDKNCLQATTEFSRQCENAIIFVVFNRTEAIVRHLRKMLVYSYILDKVLIDKSDHVALREVTRLKSYEQDLVDKALKESLFAYDDKVTWLYKGVIRNIRSQRDFNILLSEVCDDVYSMTPIIHNELINRQKLSSSISAARVKYLQALMTGCFAEDLGFEQDKFPPEKTIYYSLLKNTGLHTCNGFADHPTDKGIAPLWSACEDFFNSTRNKKKSVKDLITILSRQPYGIKAGILDFWIPTFLYIKRQDYSLFSKDGRYIPEVNMEFFELLKKHPGEFFIKALVEDGIKLAFYNQYRRLVGQGAVEDIREDKFIEAIKPFFFFYKRLNQYAKTTKKFDSITTLRFRDVLAKAQDPEKTFFEDLPEAFGYDKALLTGEEFVGKYCELMQNAIRELRTCYHSLIARIEAQLVERLGLSSPEYAKYIMEIRSRLSHVKQHLLNAKQKDFLYHVTAEFEDKTEWYQSVGYAAMNQPLEQLRDEQEIQLVDNIVYLFKECEKQAVISEAMDFPASEDDKKKAMELEAKIDSELSGRASLDVYVLLESLKKRMSWQA